MDPAFSMIPGIQCEEYVVVRLISRVAKVDSIFATRNWRLEKPVVLSAAKWLQYVTTGTA
jgi:hypothetical protein